MEKTNSTPEGRALVWILKRYRIEAGLTQAQLGARVGWLQKTVCEVEAGQRRVDVVELRVLARALGTTLPEMIARFEAEIPTWVKRAAAEGRTSYRRPPARTPPRRRPRR